MKENFNTSNVTIQPPDYISEKIMKENFNTSNVTIQPPDYISEKIMKENFNTSNVTIQLLICSCTRIRIHHFNTSNVTIQRDNSCLCKNISVISIHLMLLFNEITVVFARISLSFQYI